MNIGKRIAAVRAAKGLTQKDLKAKFNKNYDHIECGRMDLKFRELLKVCKALDIEIWELTAEKLIIEIKD